jgi:hypothetical protein
LQALASNPEPSRRGPRDHDREAPEQEAFLAHGLEAGPKDLVPEIRDGS